jgi:anaerobic selenocysteine-containing dehydrogenase
MKLDRRKFIKLGAVGSGALALPNPMQLAEQKRKPWNRQQARTLRKFRNPRPTTCGLCANHCGLISYREGDRIVMLHGNPEHPVNRGKLCGRAYGQLDRLYDPDRILKPRVRVGKRGAGEWREISWAEAYRIASEKLAPYVENGGRGLTLMFGRRELLDGHLQELFPQALVVEDGPEVIVKALRRQLYGVTGCRRDYARSRFILNFAADPYTRGSEMVSEVQRLIQGRVENGARLVTVAARLSNTGGRGEGWIPVKPADYGVLARALAWTLLEERLFDAVALSRQNFTVAELKQELREYRPEKVEKAIGVKAGEIRKLARQLARRQPAMVIYDDELLNAADGPRSALAIELLNILIGALGRPGGIFYFDQEQGLAAALKRPAGKGGQPPVSADWFLASGVKSAIINYACNPAYAAADEDKRERDWRSHYRVPFHLAIDTHLSETSRYADLILPAATDLEAWGLEDYLLDDGQRALSLKQPVSRFTDEILLLRKARLKNLDLLFSGQPRRPVAEARDFNQIVLDLRQLLAGGRLEEAPRLEEWLEKSLKGSEFAAAGIDFSVLREKGFQLYKGSRPTVAARIKAAAADFSSAGQSPELKSEDDFYLIPYRWHLLDNETANCKYLAEIRHDNPLWIHPRQAARLGLAEGDQVRVETAAGSIFTKAWLTEAIHPQCVAMAVGLGHKDLGRVARGQKIADSDPMTRALLIHKPLHFTPFSFRLDSWDKKEPIWWHKDGNGANIQSILSRQPDQQLAGTTRVETVVRVWKV